MSTSSPVFLGNAFDSGIGRWLKVDAVCCGRHNVGSLNSRKTFNVPEMFIETVKEVLVIEDVAVDENR